jgi:hypothetical protein
MIVVSDTSVITSLIHIGRENLLQELHGAVLIPPAVHEELRNAKNKGTGGSRAECPPGHPATVTDRFRRVTSHGTGCARFILQHRASASQA